jgi:hypothetical protein
MNKLALNLNKNSFEILTDIENKIDSYKMEKHRIFFLNRLSIPSMFKRENVDTHYKIEKYLQSYVNKK